MLCRLPRSTLFPYTTLFRSWLKTFVAAHFSLSSAPLVSDEKCPRDHHTEHAALNRLSDQHARVSAWISRGRSEEHTSELQSLAYIVCRLLLEKKNSQAK